MSIVETTLPASTLLASQYSAVRDRTIQICEPLEKEDYVVQPVGDVSPPKWHLGHTTWFFEVFILQNFKKDYQVFHEDYSYVFNSYYESVGKRVVRTNRGNLTRPTVDEVLAYRKHVDTEMLSFLNSSEKLPDKAKEIYTLGLQHEQQHQELLIYDIKYILGNNPLLPAYQKKLFKDTSGNEPVPEENYFTLKEGVYDIGFSGDGFCFDNELGQHKVFIHASRILNRLITNQEYLEFINAGGYTSFQYWLSEGWEWLKSEQIKAPLYWHFMDGEWFYYTMQGLQKLNLAAPVTHVSFYEADAFARWKGKRLPTEFEWEIACKTFSPEIPASANFQDNRNYEPLAREGDGPSILWRRLGMDGECLQTLSVF